MLSHFSGKTCFHLEYYASFYAYIICFLTCPMAKKLPIWPALKSILILTFGLKIVLSGARNSFLGKKMKLLSCFSIILPSSHCLFLLWIGHMRLLSQSGIMQWWWLYSVTCGYLATSLGANKAMLERDNWGSHKWDHSTSWPICLDYTVKPRKANEVRPECSQWFLSGHLWSSPSPPQHKVTQMKKGIVKCCLRYSQKQPRASSRQRQGSKVRGFTLTRAQA